MSERIVIIQGHPDRSAPHLLHAMAASYEDGARAAGHDVRRIEVAQLDFPLLRDPVEFEKNAAPPPALAKAQEDMRWADHWVIFFPLWHGAMPALLKGFFEQVFRPGFAMEYTGKGFPKSLLKGKSAQVVVTMSTPPLFYRWILGAFGVRSLERSILSFAGIKPIRETLYGLAMAKDKDRARWLADMQRAGARGA
jgi:putative NADPH-quinone reductase